MGMHHHAELEHFARMAEVAGLAFCAVAIAGALALWLA
jgi:hypothetical protein